MEIKEESSFIHESSYIDEYVTIGKGTKVWHFCHVQRGARIGDDCTLGQNAYIGEDVTIGNNVKIQNNVSIYSGVTLEDYVFCGPSVVFTNDYNPRSRYPKGKLYMKTHVCCGASIGGNATIICGVRIGKNALIGAGAVVTKDVPDYGLVLGIPARLVGWVCECGRKLGDELLCAGCGKKYRYNNLVIEDASE